MCRRLTGDQALEQLRNITLDYSDGEKFDNDFDVQSDYDDDDEIDATAAETEEYSDSDSEKIEK